MSPTTAMTNTAQYSQGQASWSSPFYRSSGPGPSPRYNPQQHQLAAAYGSYTSQSYGGVRTMPTASQSSSSSQSSTQNSYGEQLSKTNLYIRGLTPNTTDKDLVNLCQQFGKIVSTKAIIDQNTNKCKGYGFVDFESPMAAETAVKALQSQGVQAQMAKQQEQDPTNLYIANLPTYMSENDLESMFTPFGQVISTRILRDNNSMSRGVGFCRMESREKCENIIQALNGKCIPGWQEPLTVKFADGGNKKKSRSQQWVDRQQSQDNNPLAYDPSSGYFSVAPTVMTPPSVMPRYTMAQTPVNYHHLSSAAWPLQYIVQPQVTPYVTGPHGTYTQLAYPHSTPMLQPMTQVEY